MRTNHNTIVFSSGWASPRTIIQEYNEENVVRLACYLHRSDNEARMYKRDRGLPLPRPGVFLVSRIMQSLSACAEFYAFSRSIGR